MANLNKVMLIGRLTRDPEIRTFGNGGKVAAFGFAVNNKKKDPTTGQWIDEPCFLDVKAFNRDTGRKLADTIEQYFKKGHQYYIEGHMVMETWEDKNGGGKRSKLVITMETFEFLEPRQDGGSGEGMARPPRIQSSAPQQRSNVGGGYSGEPEETAPPENGSGPDESIPF